MEAKRRTLGLLVVLAALLGAALWAVTQSNAASQAASSAAEEGSISLCSFSSQDLESIQYTYQGQTFTLQYDSGSWTLAQDPDYHLDASACNTMVTALSTLKAKRQLTPQAGEDYGLENPELTVTVTAAGETTTFLFGAQNGVTGDQYLCREGEQTLYTVSGSKSACFALDKAGLFGSFCPAGLTASEVQQLSYTLQDGTTVSLTAGSEPAEEADASSEAYQTVWRFTGDPDTAVDQDRVQEMLSALTSYVSGQITPADGADPAACGFATPLATVELTTAGGTKTLTYASGTDGYYLQVEGENSLYSVDSSVVQAILQNAEDLTV